MALRIALALLFCATFAAAVDPVPELNPLSYIGRWYQMYSDLASSLIESRFCVTADYGVFPNITVSVRNEERTNSPTGPFKQILGYATLTPGQPGELNVYLQGVPVPAPYWVVGLGPVSILATAQPRDRATARPRSRDRDRNRATATATATARPRPQPRDRNRAALRPCRAAALSDPASAGAVASFVAYETTLPALPRRWLRRYDDA